MRYREIQLFNIIKTAFISDNVFFSVDISEAEKDQLRTIVSNAVQNPNENDYPDFLDETGTIELFEITSSKVKRKGGSAQIREKKKYDHRVMGEQLEILRRPIESEDDYLKQYGWEFDRPKHSHNYLIESLKKNWDKHTKSLKKYSGGQNVSIFAIGYFDMALSAIDKEVDRETDYKLSYDSDALQFLNANAEDIDFVIFATQFYVEVIKTSVPYDCYPKQLCFKENNVGTATIMHRVRTGEMKKNEQN